VTVTDAAGATSRPPFDANQEVRFAIVMYGGVSLAIYINGVAQELLHLVRATAPEAPLGAEPTFAKLAPQALESTERVYRKLGQMLDIGAPDTVTGELAPIRTRFVVDILSGSSAGGINAVFLAKALANDQEIKQLRNLWVEKADIAVLINDKGSLKGPPWLPNKRPPKSVLNSRRMYCELLDALEGMEVPARSDGATLSPYVDELDLWVTNTDLNGRDVTINLADGVATEKRYKNVLHFQYGTLYATGKAKNDFGADRNPFLAYAARCTAAFPVAFEPMQLDAIDDALDRFNIYKPRSDLRAASGTWKTSFAPEYGPLPYWRIPFADGGYLDNKPFSYAIDSLRKRRSDRIVERKLLYVEPDPSAPPEARPDDELYQAPNALQNAFLAAHKLPRSETIREDIERVRSQNRVVERVRELSQILERSMGAVADEVVGLAYIDDNAWLNESLADAAKRGGLGYVAYRQLKISQVVDDLAGWMARARGLDVDSDEFAAIRHLVAAWVDATYRPDLLVEGPGATPTEPSLNQFLRDYDLGYRVRRLDYVREAINLRLGLVPAGPERDALLHAKTALGSIRTNLRAVGDRISAPGGGTPALEAALESLSIRGADLRWILGGGPAERVLCRVKAQQGSAAVELDLARLDDQTLPIQASGFTIAVTPAPVRPRYVEWLGRRGLDCGDAVEIVLPNPSDWFELEVAASDSVRVEAYSGDARLDLTLDFDGIAPRMLPINEPGLTRVVIKGSEGAPEGADGRAARLLGLPAHGQAVSVLATVIADELQDAFVAAGGAIDEAIGHDDDLSSRYAKYEAYDLVRLPTLWPRVGEGTVVEVARISPRDAPSLIDEPAEERRHSDRRKLAGVAVGHFGGFVERSWRKNDVMWGRLDGAERLIATLLPATHPQRDELIAEAHRIILDEELADSDRVPAAVRESTDPDALRSWFRESYRFDPSTDSQKAVRSMGRITAVVGDLLDGLSSGQGAMKTPALWLVRLGRLMTGFAELAIPRTPWALIRRHWLRLLIAIGVVLVIVGGLAGVDAAQHVGWVCVGVGVGVWFILQVLHDVFTRRWKSAALLLGALVILGLVVLGAIQVAGWLGSVGDGLGDFYDWVNSKI
jgi:patatin-related protein